jgi:hypothetical protein
MNKSLNWLKNQEWKCNDFFIFENKVAAYKMQLNGQFALCPAIMECPEQDLLD